MRPIATDGVAWSICVSVIVLHFGGPGRGGADSCESKEQCVRWWSRSDDSIPIRVESQVSDAAFLKIILDTFSFKYQPYLQLYDVFLLYFVLIQTAGKSVSAGREKCWNHFCRCGSQQMHSDVYQVGKHPCTECRLLPCDSMLARYMLSSCVGPSVRPSHAGIVPKRLNVRSRKQRRTIDQRLYFSDAKISAKFRQDHPNGGAN